MTGLGCLGRAGSQVAGLGPADWGGDRMEVRVEPQAPRPDESRRHMGTRPISLLRLSLPRFVAQTFKEIPLRISSREIKIQLESNPLKSRILVRRLAVSCLAGAAPHAGSRSLRPVSRHGLAPGGVPSTGGAPNALKFQCAQRDSLS